MKIVIPTYEDKKTIFKRTGHAPYFSIFENEKFLKAVENNHAKSHHEHEEHTQEEINHHIEDIQNLKECDVILLKTVGKNMSAALDSIGLKIVKIDTKTDNATIAIKEFLKTV